MKMHLPLLCSTLLVLLLVNCARRQPATLAPVVEAVPPPAPPAPAPLPTAAARDLADIMATDLHLTPTQTEQVRQILNGTVTQVNAARQQHPAKSPQLNAELQRISTAAETQLKQTLGPAKYQQFQREKRQMQAQMQSQVQQRAKDMSTATD